MDTHRRQRHLIIDLGLVSTHVTMMMMLLMMIVMIPILVILVGIVTDDSDEQYWKALSGMEVNESGMTTAPTGQSNQAANDVTDDGIIDGGSDVLANADAPNDKIVVIVVIVDDDDDDTNEGNTSRNSNRR